MKKVFILLVSLFAMMSASMGLKAQEVKIRLMPGWNLISYPYPETVSLENFFGNYSPMNGDMIESQFGYSDYNGGEWFGEVDNMEPGRGYIYYSSRTEDVEFFVFGDAANDPSALPKEALDGEFTVASNGTKVRFSPGNLQCRIDPNKESQITVGTGTSTTAYMPYYTWYNYSICQMIYKADELRAAGLKAGPVTGIAFESYSTNHFLRTGVHIWMSATTMTAAPSTSVSTSGMTQVYNGTVTQQTGWTEIDFTSSPFTWDGTSNLMVTVVMNHGSYSSSTNWQCSYPGFTCSSYKYTDGSAYDPSSTIYSMNTSTSRPNTRFTGRGGVVWRFAEHQTDYIGEGNANISDTYTGLIDLFGWGTSGHPHGAVCYQPWSMGLTNSDYYAYGDTNYNLFDQNGEADWGCNPIANGGDKPGQWRTLTTEEWAYVFNTRSTPSGKRYAKANVRGVNGIILLPDNWSTSYYSLNSTNTANVAFTSNTISSSQWQTLEEHGAAFLPAAGARAEDMVVSYNTTGGYWSSTRYSDGSAYYVDLSGGGLGVQSYASRSYGFAVRLVCQSNPRIRTLGMTNVTQNSATANAEVDYTGSATVTERGVCFGVDVAPTVNNSFQSAGTGTGGFTAQLTNLGAGTTYHVRAYAKIGGIYIYGNELTFTTARQPSVNTAEVNNITVTSALCGGTVSECGQNVTAKGLCWGTSSSPTISGSHSYDGTGTGSFTGILTNLSPSTTYYVRAYATTAAGTVYGNQRSFTTQAYHAYVNLGLPSGLLWATCNVGASTPEGYGDYFAWGETTPKDIYSWGTYQYGSTSVSMTKYTGSDGLTTLLPEDDAATANWGNGWRMPTKQNFQELFNNTTVTRTQQNGVNGLLFTAANGNSLFLPAAGDRWNEEFENALIWGLYWSSSLNTSNPSEAWDCYFNLDYNSVSTNGRFYGQSVRPVREN